MEITEHYIEDKWRKAAMNCARSCKETGGSVAYIAPPGYGKTELLKKIKSEFACIEISSFALAHQILGKMAEQSEPKSTKKDHYREIICKMNRKIFVCDEAQELRQAVYPYFKSIMDAGHTLIFAGETEFYTSLCHKKNQALRSRLTFVEIERLSFDELYTLYQDIDREAFEVLHGGLDNMREIKRVVTDCRIYAKAEKIEIIDKNIISLFLPK